MDPLHTLQVDISDLTNDNVFLLNGLSDDCKLEQDSNSLSKCEGET